MQGKTAREFLANLFAEKRNQNAAYSLRAFSRDLKISAATMSALLSGKRRVTASIAARIARNIRVPEHDKAVFLKLAGSKRKLSLRTVARTNPYKSHPRVLSSQIFRAIVNPLHNQIMALTRTEGFQSNTEWIAKRLAVTPAECQDAIDRLKSLGLLDVVEGRLVVNPPDMELITSDMKPEEVLPHNKKILDHALAASLKLPQEERAISSMTIVMDPLDMARANDVIKEFRRSLSGVLESGRKAEVYTLSIQLVPNSVPIQD